MKKLLEEKGTGGKRIGAWPFVEVSGLDKRTPGHRIRVTLHARRASFRFFDGETHARRIWMSASLASGSRGTVHAFTTRRRPAAECVLCVFARSMLRNNTHTCIDLFIFSTFSSFQFRITSTYLSSNYKLIKSLFIYYRYRFYILVSYWIQHTAYIWISCLILIFIFVLRFLPLFDSKKISKLIFRGFLIIHFCG